MNMKNPFVVLRDRPILEVMVKILDDQSITSLTTLYKVVEKCLLELSDKEIKSLMHDRIIDCWSPDASYTLNKNGEKLYVGWVMMPEALDSKKTKLAEMAAKQFKEDLSNIRNYIRFNYRF